MIVTFCFVAAEIHSKYTFRFPFRLGHSQGRATLQGRVLTPNSAAPCPGSLDVTPLVVMYFDTYIYNICIYIQIYMVNPHQGLPWAFFCGICSRNKTYILLSSILCDSHTTTQVWYSLTLVFLQFHLVTPHPRTPRLPSLQSKVAFVEELGWIRVMLFKTCFTSFIGM